MIHLLLYTADEKFDLAQVASEIYLRIYLTIGFAGILCLFALAVTSTDGMVARMGIRTWRRLHRLVFVVALLGSIHFFMQAKADVWEPLWMSGLFVWLVAYRLIAWQRNLRAGLSATWLFVLAPLIGLLTALGEALYYHLVNGVDPLLVLQANLGTMAGIRPSWIVLTVGLIIAVAGVLRGAGKRRATRTAPAPRVAANEGISRL
jgi:sulfoxide reductase heme-binding subunit YedZ